MSISVIVQIKFLALLLFGLRSHRQQLMSAVYARVLTQESILSRRKLGKFHPEIYIDVYTSKVGQSASSFEFFHSPDS